MVSALVLIMPSYSTGQSKHFLLQVSFRQSYSTFICIKVFSNNCMHTLTHTHSNGCIGGWSHFLILSEDTSAGLEDDSATESLENVRSIQFNFIYIALNHDSCLKPLLCHTKSQRHLNIYHNC